MTKKDESLQVRERCATLTELRGLWLFRGCSDAEIAQCIRNFGATVRLAAKGEVIVHEGRQVAWTMVILTGTLELYDTSMDGERMLVRVFELGGFLGMSLSMRPMLDYYPYMIVAGTPAEILTFDVAKIHERWYEAGYKTFFTNLFLCFSDYVKFARDKFAILNLRDADDRILLYLRRRAEELGTCDFHAPFANSQQMAEFLGITRTSLSRSLASLTRAGKIVHLGHGHFILLKKSPKCYTCNRISFRFLLDS